MYQQIKIYKISFRLTQEQKYKKILSKKLYLIKVFNNKKYKSEKQKVLKKLFYQNRKYKNYNQVQKCLTLMEKSFINKKLLTFESIILSRKALYFLYFLILLFLFIYMFL